MSNPGDFAYTVKQQADIVRIVGDYVTLKKSGAQNFAGLCPFHKEKSPSFSVHAGKQFFHCFGCGVSGDVFSFVQKIENSSFPEAVRTVATKVGIPLPKQNFSPAEAREANMRGKLLDLHESATQFFEAQLQSPAGAAAREYLANRGMPPEIIRQFRLGFAPDSGYALRDKLKSEFDEATLKQSGAFAWKDEQAGISGLYSRFRNRVMLPIANENGKVIAFTGRILQSDKDKNAPKYLNSAESAVYTKGHVLFNLDKAKEAIRQLDYSIVVEGNFDCISVYMAGLHNVIASSGTAFTEAQVRLLGRFNKNIIVNFDPDTAGAAATERSLAMLVEEEFNIRVVQLEQGLDPDLYIRNQGAEAYKQEIRDAQKYFHYLIDRAQQKFAKVADGKLKAVNYLLPHIQRVPSRITRDELSSDIAQRLGIDSAVLRQELKAAVATRAAQPITAQNEPIYSNTERLILRALLGIAGEEPGEASELQYKIATGLRDENLHKGLASAQLIDSLLEWIRAGGDDAQLSIPEHYRDLVATLHFKDGDKAKDGVVATSSLLASAIGKLRLRKVELEIIKIQHDIKVASARHDVTEVQQLTLRKTDLKKQLSQLTLKKPTL